MCNLLVGNYVFGLILKRLLSWELVVVLLYVPTLEFSKFCKSEGKGDKEISTKMLWSLVCVFSYIQVGTFEDLFSEVFCGQYPVRGAQKAR